MPATATHILSAAHPLAMANVAFLTCHGKARLVAEPLAGLGFHLETVDSYDTDHFGTFCRDVARLGSAQDTVLAKAKLAASLGGTRYGLGSEGSFGRDPHIGWLPWNHELLCLWDAEREYAVLAAAGSGATNYAQAEISCLTEAETFISKAQFPAHALIIGRPGEAWFNKGIQNREWLLEQLDWLLSRHASVWLETDMRAHLNPQRQQVIAQAGDALARRLAQRCPSCQAVGFAIARSEPGLLCADCCMGTSLAAAYCWECPDCGHSEREIIHHQASPAHCDYCNP